jgi:hypothetical protein
MANKAINEIRKEGFMGVPRRGVGQEHHGECRRDSFATVDSTNCQHLDL